MNDLNIIRDVIVSNTYRINFEDYLIELGGDPEKYTTLTLPNKIRAVIVVEYLKQLSNKIDYPIKQVTIDNVDLKSVYVYNGKYWISVSESWVRDVIGKVIIRMGDDPVESKTSEMILLLIKTFWFNCERITSRRNSKTLINVLNATLEISSNGEVFTNKHSSNNFITYCLPYNYLPNSKPKLFLEFLNRVLPDVESQNVLQELFGNVFIKNMNLEKIGILYGNGSNGKSVLLNLFGSYSPRLAALS